MKHESIDKTERKDDQKNVTKGFFRKEGFMPLCHIDAESTVNQIRPTSFQSEKQLQNLFELNLGRLLGVRDVSS